MFGKLLKTFTNDTGINQKMVAEKLNYSPQRVGNYYRDIAEPPHEFLKKFKTEFSVDLKRLKEKSSKELASVETSYNPLPVFNLDAKPTNKLDFFNHQELVMYYVSIPFYNDCQALIVVSGQSMAPAINPSDLVAIKKISDFDTIPFGESFYIITDEQRLVRHIHASDVPGCFTLRAANPKYDDIKIEMNKIRHLFQVKGKLSRL